jgi:hypothetical protein
MSKKSKFGAVALDRRSLIAAGAAAATLAALPKLAKAPAR